MQLRPPARLVDPRARAYWATENLLGVVVLAAGLTAWSIWGGLGGVWRYAAFLLLIVMAVVGVVVVPWGRYRIHRWEVTDTAVYTQRGWLTIEQRIAPISRVQTVDTERGAVARLFGLASVRVTTASAKGELKIDGLSRSLAEQIATDLTVVTAADPGDAT
ncbi:PH domain-containing protein [Rudaeicoccus suwonensis]|uniref:YdbS-like PH domain-containing protein n=1 Tax=Rudaeicoccus suwonensis TaxID=657409 RepID=A0A561E863_9MICO|nr:PH domain-containing protein [Rudaeicoccus suwonensis]TWE11786.1 hypothetical protein BKA23_0572 [Rudaeicoccus suwonensis]